MFGKGRSRPKGRGFGLVSGLSAIFTLGIVALVFIGGLAFVGLRQFYGPGPATEERVFTVERGSGLSTAAAKLAQEGIISNPLVFRLGAMAKRQDSELRQGDFRFPAGASMADVLRELTEGRPVQYAVTIPEGFTSWQIVERLNAAPDLVGEITEIPPEGTLLPNTYSFERGATRQSVLGQMQDAHKQELERIWASRNPDLPIGNPEELVTLASIVEKETGVPDERPRVASVFVNRLEEGMRLQSDPTIIYGITEGRGPLGRGLRRSEIDRETPYNTYQIDGLPPGPIANPGIESMEAVANPADTDELYFVAAGPVPSDGHVFAESYEEHQRNVARWREIEREAAAQPAPAERAQAERAAVVDATEGADAALLAE